MTDTPDDPIEPAPAKKLPRLSPFLTIDSVELGPLAFRHPSIRDTLKVAKVAGEDHTPPEAFVTALLAAIGRRPEADGGDDEVRLSPDDIAKLTPDERASVVSALLSELSDMFYDAIKVEGHDDGEDVAKASRKLVVPREDAESDEAYLQRGWREYWKRQMAPFSKMATELSASTAGLTEAWKKAVMPDLFANRVSSLDLSNQIARMALNNKRLTDDLALPGLTQAIRAMALDLGGASKLARSPALDIISRNAASQLNRHATMVPKPVAIGDFKLPPNPVLATNELLETIGDHIADMRDLAAKTAEMHVLMNDATGNILTLFSKGAADARIAAEKAEKSGRTALRVANITALLTFIAVVAAIWGVLYQDNQTSKRDAASAAASAAQRIALQANAAASRQLAAALEASRAPPAKKVWSKHTAR